MAGLNETPSGSRLHISFFGLRNAGKSTLVNALTGQDLAIVSDVPGTTTDPVSKAMEILPLGPCTVTDTAGLDDDQGELGAERVAKTLRVLETTDVAVWVSETPSGRNRETADETARADLLEKCRARGIVTLDYRRGDDVEAFRRCLAAVRIEEPAPGLLDGIVESGDRVICVCPIDASAPKGRLILPQVQLLRDAIDRHVSCVVCQPEELADCLDYAAVGLKGRLLVVTDSQAFRSVSETLRQCSQTVPGLALTSFSILFARQKGDLAVYLKGIDAISRLKDGDTVLVAEGCTHHRQCNDIGTVKIPKAVTKLSGGKKLDFTFASGGATAARQFQLETLTSSPPALVVHCGGCMLTRREVMRRIALAQAAHVPIVNYGLVLAAAAGVPISDESGRQCIQPVPGLAGTHSCSPSPVWQAPTPVARPSSVWQP